MKYLLLLVGGYTITRAVLPRSLKLMKEFGLTAKNYRGATIPMPAGLIPVIVFLFMLTVAGIFFQWSQAWFILLFALAFVSLGIMDDLMGTLEHKGFKGHLKALAKGKITTGLAKAAIGGLLAFTAAWILGEPGIGYLLLNTLVIALSTNFINLMDLRPGRAVKVFLVISLLLLSLGQTVRLFWLVPLIGAILAYFPWDLNAKGMLGDTGANLMGFMLGLALVQVLEFPGKIIILGFLLGVHFYAEKFSISVLIEENPLLKYLDQLGRPEYLGGDGAD